MENLNEGKKKKGAMTYEAALREIDAQSAIVAMEAKIAKLKEMAEAKEARLNMVSEDENLSELIDKRAMNEMKKEIKQIKKMQEKLEKLYEKKNGKKMPEMVDEEEKVDEMVDPTNMDLDKAVYGDDAERDPATGNIKEDELDEAHCNTEEDDVNEEFLRMQKLAGVISEEEYKTQVNELFGIGKGKKNEWHYANQYQGSDNDFMYIGTLKGPKNGKDEKGADKAIKKHVDQIGRSAVLILAEPGYRGFNGKKSGSEIADDPKVVNARRIG